MTKDIERFEEVFKKSIQTMHEVNVKQFGSAMANIMLPALEQMKPIFKIVYEQGVTDGSKKIEGCVVVPVDSLNKTIDAFEDMFEDDPTLALGELLPIQQDIKAMLEAARGGNE